jgi:hypothetical protein
MPAASTIKVLISAALWCAVEDGELAADRRLTAGEAPAPGGGGLLESFDPATALTVADLNVLMLALSDNAATNALIDVVGLDRVNQLAARLGLERTAVRRSMMDVEAAERGDDNVTCAGDMATLMAALGRAVEIPPAGGCCTPWGSPTTPTSLPATCPLRAASSRASEGCSKRCCTTWHWSRTPAPAWRWRCCRRRRVPPRAWPGSRPTFMRLSRPLRLPLPNHPARVGVILSVFRISSPEEGACVNC